MKWKYLLLVLLLVFCLGLAGLSGLTEEEKAELPNLSRQSLIELIMIYDKDLTETEILYTERQSELQKRPAEGYPRMGIGETSSLELNRFSQGSDPSQET